MLLASTGNCFNFQSRRVCNIWKLWTGFYYFPISEHNHKNSPHSFMRLVFFTFRHCPRNIGTKIITWQEKHKGAFKAVGCNPHYI
jgi:hypothetical protein